VLIWAMRRLARAMVEAGPLARCGVVEAALIREFGARGQEMGVLLRCVVQGLRVGARRPLLLCGGAGCVGNSPKDMEMLSEDEQALLAALRTPCAAILEPILESEQAAIVGQMLKMIAGLMRET
jgi:hypothetical protein